MILKINIDNSQEIIVDYNCNRYIYWLKDMIKIINLLIVCATVLMCINLKLHSAEKNLIFAPAMINKNVSFTIDQDIEMHPKERYFLKGDLIINKELIIKKGAKIYSLKKDQIKYGPNGVIIFEDINDNIIYIDEKNLNKKFNEEKQRFFLMTMNKNHTINLPPLHPYKFTKK